MNKSFSLLARASLLFGSAFYLGVPVQAAVLRNVNMSAHIIESSIANLKETEWTLYKTTVIAGGDANAKNNLISTKLNSFTGAIKSVVLPNGKYILRAQYGDAVSVKIFEIKDKASTNFINLKMVFNLGALKISSRLGNREEVIANGVKYVVRNIETGKLVLETEDISKTHYLNQGEYNITAHLNDITVTEANIKIIANNMNDVIIRHKVGEIKLNIDNIKSQIGDKQVIWRVQGAKSNIDKKIDTSEKSSSVFLPAGDYQLLTEWNDYSYITEFGMHPGQIIEFAIPSKN